MVARTLLDTLKAVSEDERDCIAVLERVSRLADDSVGVDDYSSETDVIIIPSALDFVSQDEMLTPLGRLDKYAASENIFNRQMVARTLLDTLKAVSEDERDCIAVLERVSRLADDSEPTVRAELMEQVPHIAIFCQENRPSIPYAFSKYLLPIVVAYLADQNNQVRKTSQAALLVLLEQELLERYDIETKVCPVLVDLIAPDSNDDVKTEAMAIICKMAPMVGKDITERLFLPRFCEMCCDCRMFHVRKVCAANFGDICTVVGREATEELLLPRFFQLCSDNVWGVRKACAECFMTVSSATSQGVRRTKLSCLFINLISDPSRWLVNSNTCLRNRTYLIAITDLKGEFCTFLEWSLNILKANLVTPFKRFYSETDVIIIPSALDFVSQDEMLTPLGRLDKYAASENIFNRQMVARTLLDTLKAVSEDERDCIAVLERVSRLADDSEPTVRAELMEQVPHIAIFCQENRPSIPYAFSKYLLPIVVAYLADQNNQVRKTSQAALLVLLEQELLERYDIETKVCPVLVDLIAPDSNDDVKTEAMAIICKMAPMVGKDITERLFLPRFCEMCCDVTGPPQASLVCAANFGDICTVVGREATEELLLPRFFQLCSDNVWGVRKACAECFMTVSSATSQGVRRTKLSCLFINLISDPSRWVRQAAFQSLGQFISTFANPASSEPTVRAELMEQVPHIAIFCQENRPSIPYAFSKYLLPIVVAYLADQNNQVRKTSQAALLVLLEQELLERYDIETKVCPVLVDLIAPDSNDDVKTEAMAIICKMAPMVGKDITERLFLPRFCEMCCDCRMFHVRKVCAANFGDICTVVGREATEELLLPRFFQLCSDNVWGVRKACAECFMTVSSATSQGVRRTKLSCLFINLISDPSRWVRQAAFQSLGQFISTFANPASSGQYFKEEEEPEATTSTQPHSSSETETPAADSEPKVPSSNCGVSICGEDAAIETEVNGQRCRKTGENSQSSELLQNPQSWETEEKPQCCETRESEPCCDIKNHWCCRIEEDQQFCDSTSSSNQQGEEEEDSQVFPSIQDSAAQNCGGTTCESQPLFYTSSHSKPADISTTSSSSSSNTLSGTISKDKPIPEQELYNSFHYWRNPLPLIDLELELQQAQEAQETQKGFPKPLSPRSPLSSISPARRKELEEMIENLEPHVDDPDVKAQVDVLTAALRASTLESQLENSTHEPSDNRIETQREAATPDHFSTDAVPLITDTADKEDVVPQALLDQYLSMTDPSHKNTLSKFLFDFTELRAQVFVLIALQCHGCLCKRRQDCFVPLQLLHKEMRREYLYQLQEFLVTDNSRNWRFRAELAEQLVLLLDLYCSKDVYDYLRPLAFSLCMDKVSSVRWTSYKLIREIIRKLSSDSALVADFMAELVAKFCHCPKWSGRQAFAFVCQSVIEDDCVSMDLFAEHMLPPLLQLACDPVPNVRVLLAKILRHSLLEKDYFVHSASSHQEALEQTLVALQVDLDKDVQYFASVHPASTRLADDAMSTTSSTY
ncbi:UNVERIFIED_CONTAM: hypothetical protein FKN15_032838 [Acipenser sinensis]